MKHLTIRKTTHDELEREQLEEWRQMTPEQRIGIVEQLRIQAGKMGLYEYPCRHQRVIRVIKKAQR